MKSETVNIFLKDTTHIEADADVLRQFFFRIPMLLAMPSVAVCKRHLPDHGEFETLPVPVIRMVCSPFGVNSKNAIEFVEDYLDGNIKSVSIVKNYD